DTESVRRGMTPPEVDVVPHLPDPHVLAGAPKREAVLPEDPLAVHPHLYQTVGSAGGVHADMTCDAGPAHVGERFGEDAVVAAEAIPPEVVRLHPDRDLAGAGSAGAHGIEHVARRPAGRALRRRLATLRSRHPRGVGQAGELS